MRVSTALGAVFAATTAVCFQAGCTGILGISPGTSSDGSEGSPCNVQSDTPTYCSGPQNVCVLNVCRVQCTADSDCTSTERCIVGDGNSGGNNNNNSNGYRAYGCVPLSATSCSTDGCPSPDVCDPSGQCRSSCSPGSGSGYGCASDQSCTNVAGQFACYGPHDTDAPDGSLTEDGPTGSSSGAEDAGEDGGSSCNGTPSYASCAECEASGCNCPGCSTQEVAGECTGTPLSCAACGTLYSCNPIDCPDCVSGSTTACQGTPSYSTCASCPTSYCGSSSYCPGCTLSSGSCNGAQAASCATFTTLGESYCLAAGCGWIATGGGGGFGGYTCEGTPSPCSSFTSSTGCDDNYYCSWSGSASCTGTLTPCASNLSASACESEGCSWTTADCSGTPRPCTDFTTAATCSQIGCRWTTGVGSACTGTIEPCGSLSAGMCSEQPGCSVTSSSGGSSGGFNGSSSSSGGGTSSASGGPEDAEACDDASGGCNCLALSGPVVDLVASQSSLKLPSGGTIPSGTYVLTSATYYVESGTAPPSGSTVGTVQSTIVIAGSSWEQVAAANGQPPATDSGTFSTSGVLLHVTRSCPDNGTSAWDYTSTGSTVTIYVPNGIDAGAPASMIIETYTLEP